MNGTNARNTVEKLRCTFAYLGLPEELVSDNGPPFNGEEYRDFCKSNGITCKFSPPLHPCSNGLAERAVATIKSSLKKQLYEHSRGKLHISLQHQLNNFLLKYRTTPTSINEKSPAEMMFRQIPRTKVTMLKEKGDDKCTKRNTRFGVDNDKRKMREFTEDQDVLVQLIKNGKPSGWTKGKVFKRISLVTYLVWVNNAMKVIHADYLRESHLIPDNHITELDNHGERDNQDNHITPCIHRSDDIQVDKDKEEAVEDTTTISVSQGKPSSPYPDPPTLIVEKTNTPVPPRTPHASLHTNRSTQQTRSGRIINKPVRLNL